MPLVRRSNPCPHCGTEVVAFSVKGDESCGLVLVLTCEKGHTFSAENIKPSAAPVAPPRLTATPPPRLFGG